MKVYIIHETNCFIVLFPISKAQWWSIRTRWKVRLLSRSTRICSDFPETTSANNFWTFLCFVVVVVIFLYEYFSLILTQNFTLTKDELGVTGVKDLSTSDMEKVRSLSLIELTALFDSHGLALHRRKPIKKRVKGKEGTVIVFLLSLNVLFSQLKPLYITLRNENVRWDVTPSPAWLPRECNTGFFSPEGHPSSYLFVEQGLTGMNMQMGTVSLGP